MQQFPFNDHKNLSINLYDNAILNYQRQKAQEVELYHKNRCDFLNEKINLYKAYLEEAVGQSQTGFGVSPSGETIDPQQYWGRYIFRYFDDAVDAIGRLFRKDIPDSVFNNPQFKQIYDEGFPAAFKIVKRKSDGKKIKRLTSPEELIGWKPAPPMKIRGYTRSRTGIYVSDGHPREFWYLAEPRLPEYPHGVPLKMVQRPPLDPTWEVWSPNPFGISTPGRWNPVEP